MNARHETLTNFMKYVIKIVFSINKEKKLIQKKRQFGDTLRSLLNKQATLSEQGGIFSKNS